MPVSALKQMVRQPNQPVVASTKKKEQASHVVYMPTQNYFILEVKSFDHLWGMKSTVLVFNLHPQHLIPHH